MSFESILIWGLAITIAVGSALLVTALRGAPGSEVARAAGEGRYRDALAAALRHPPEEGPELVAAAVAAKHLAAWDDAVRWLDRALDDDPGDGEARVERGLVEAYRGRFSDADRLLREAAAERADLAESITLHRAYTALASGDRARALSLFEEVEAPLVSKLEIDLGPGEPAFAEWFLHAAALWDAAGDRGRARWARRMAERSAPESLLPGHVAGQLEAASGAPGAEAR